MEAKTTAAMTRFIVKAGDIRIGPPHNFLIGGVSIPSSVVIVDNFPELKLCPPWRFDPGDRVIDGFEGFQRRISSADPEEPRYFFIPSSCLLRVMED